MPELPEVETVAQGLRQSLVGKSIAEVVLRRKDLRFPLPKDFARKLTGRDIHNIYRRAKYIVVEFSDMGPGLLAHLGMSGKFLIKPARPNRYETHDHVAFILDDGSACIYNDARRFGMMDFCDPNHPESHKLLRDIGPEPLSDDFTPAYLKSTLSGLSAPIKNLLLNQKIVAGVGNIYASEALFRAGIKPTRKGGSLTANEIAKLVPAIKEVLEAAIRSGGSTLRDYVRSSGDMGYFQHEFKVYDREGESCPICAMPIRLLTQAGRSSYYCQKCQH